MQYNKRLLPQPHYTLLNIKDVRHLILLRESHPNTYPDSEDFIKYRKSLKSERQISGRKVFSKYIQENHSIFDKIFQSEQFLKGLSVSLFSIYRKKDMLIKTDKSEKKRGVHEYWKSGEKGILPQKIVFVPDNKPIGIRCRDLSKIKVLYNYQPTNQNMPSCEFWVRLHLAHKPSYCNFWHWEIIMYIENQSNVYTGYDEIRNYLVGISEESEKKSEKIMRNMAKNIREELYRFLIRNPKGRKKYLPKNRYR